MVDTCVCMGAGLTIPQGMNWAQPDVPHLGFVGDSTFFASGLTGVVNAVYNHAKITLCVLDNATTAMTGSQPHPGTGIRLSPGTAHDQQKDAECAPRIPNILRALGVKHVEEIDPFKLEGAIKAIREAVAFEGPSALVFRAPCVTVAAPKPHLKVIAKNCTTCLSCIRAIGCPALTTREQQVAIDTTLCYGCGLCASVCPFDAIAVTPKGQANAEEASTAIIPEVGHSKTVTPDTTKETPGDDAMGAGGNRDD
jgi:indolepyruvate ferredoxin oxidoreductase alpha subunit